ncbi:MAG: hypothetical protein ACKPHU_36965, partial [Planctomycetaceae bacterium]
MIFLLPCGIHAGHPGTYNTTRQQPQQKQYPQPLHHQPLPKRSNSFTVTQTNDHSTDHQTSPTARNPTLLGSPVDHRPRLASL